MTPYPDIAPIGARCQLGPISRKGNAPGIGRATVETLELGPLLNIPQSNCTIQTDRGDTIIVRGNADNAQIVAFYFSLIIILQIQSFSKIRPPKIRPLLRFWVKRPSLK